MGLIQVTHMSHSLDGITGTNIQVESSNINEEIMPCFKALSSYWSELTEKTIIILFRI
jgi:hypothetical protein